MTELVIELSQIYKNKNRKDITEEFRSGEEKVKRLLFELRLREFGSKGFIRLATGERLEVKIPPKLPGKPWSEILKEIRE